MLSAGRGIKTLPSRRAVGYKVSNNQINQSINASSSSALILKAAHRVTVCTEVVVHEDLAAVDDQVGGAPNTYRTTPIAAVAANKEEAASAAAAVARHRHLYRRGVSTNTGIRAKRVV